METFPGLSLLRPQQREQGEGVGHQEGDGRMEREPEQGTGYPGPLVDSDFDTGTQGQVSPPTPHGRAAGTWRSLQPADGCERRERWEEAVPRTVLVMSHCLVRG